METMNVQYDPGIIKTESIREEEQYYDHYPVTLVNGDSLILPIIPFPRKENEEERAISLLMSTGLSFAVSDTLGELLANRVATFNPDVVVGIPTLGLGWAERVARHLGHANFAPLSTTRKFWYEDSKAEELSSITSGSGKKLYLPPEVEYRVTGNKRVVIVDDVVCTGGSLLPAIRLITSAGGQVVGIGVVLTEGSQWQHVLGENNFDPATVVSIGHIPLFRKNDSGSWVPIA